MSIRNNWKPETYRIVRGYAGWKAPFIAKGGPDCAATVRGNIFATDGGQDCLTPWGVKDAKR